MQPPRFFEAIRQSAAKRWDQLEGDPEIAAPWHQLFKQVQSPRHVLSELLQNADDAGATATSVGIEKGYFVFTHNGEDFTEEHLSSMCRFGFSNKRSLHTIGFRGIGFKSTFSLGDEVELRTPTLSLCFRQRRFTEPVWKESDSEVPDGVTEIRVSLRDGLIEREIEKNLKEWLESPLSLLFFKNIRCITVVDQELRWESTGEGPVAGSTWMVLNKDSTHPLLVARSRLESFPPEALEEISRERMLASDEVVAFPPCGVDIVVGAKGLYVVLGAGVDANLPFACNAPFIQDPARLKIKDPETSPTNRWLLERSGRFAASMMLSWLGQIETSVENRSRAYNLMPDVDREDRSLPGACATNVELAFAAAIEDQAILLTDTGDVIGGNESVIIPEQLLDVWSREQTSSLLDPACRPVFSRHVSQSNCQKLINWGKLEQISRTGIVKLLQAKHLQKPSSWKRLLRLWNFIYPETTGYHPAGELESLRIVPVQGKEVLYSAAEVVRLGEKRLLASDDDWDFLAERLLVLNPNWPRYLSDQRRGLETSTANEEVADLDKASSILKSIRLEETSDVSKVIARVNAEFFGATSRPLTECVQLSQIAAKLNVNAGGSLFFATRDAKLRNVNTFVVYDKEGRLDRMLPETWASAHLLHEEYFRSFRSCTLEEWNRWVDSGRAGLLTFVPIKSVTKHLWRRSGVEDELRSRGAFDDPFYAYKNNDFHIEDWDFEDLLWAHWAELSEKDESIWAQIVEGILAQPERFWANAKAARVLQSSGRGNSTSLTQQSILPKWVLRFRELECLRDTRGFYRKPSELLRRTSETLPLLDVEAFVDTRIDSEATKPLLHLLGVGSSPTGPDRLLDRLRALSQADIPPAAALEKLYRSLDRLIDTCSTEDLVRVKKAFREERIIFTDSGDWSTTQSVFIAAEEHDLPGAEIIRGSVRDLAMWHKVGVQNRPTAELAIEWLLQIPSCSRLTASDGRRIRELLPLYPARIWDECGHWLNLAGEWVPIHTLSYCLPKQSGIPWSHLHEWVKQKTADFLRLSTETSDSDPFSSLPSLGGQIEERFQQSPLLTESPKACHWLNQLGEDLKRIESKDGETDAELIRSRASDLARTIWQDVTALELTPYIEGVPAGTPRRSEACWSSGVLYAEQRPMAKLAKVVSRELGRFFGRTDIEEAIKFCFDRPADYVTDYMEEHFRLMPREITDSHADQFSVPSASDKELSQIAPVFEAKRTGTPNSEAETVEISHEGNGFLLESERVDQDAEPPTYVVPERMHAQAKPPKPSIMERFAVGHGFKKDSFDRFYRDDGDWIGKPAGDRFWEWRTVRGEVTRYLYAREICLEREPLEIEAEDWRMIEAYPETHSMILVDRDDEPVEVSGSVICRLKEDGTLRLYQTHFRLVCEDVPQASGLLTRPTGP
jgi:hypothetical protein